MAPLCDIMETKKPKRKSRWDVRPEDLEEPAGSSESRNPTHTKVSTPLTKRSDLQT